MAGGSVTRGGVPHASGGCGTRCLAALVSPGGFVPVTLRGSGVGGGQLGGSGLREKGKKRGQATLRCYKMQLHN